MLAATLASGGFGWLSTSTARAVPEERYLFRDGVVRDAVTGLDWQRHVGPQEVPFDGTAAVCAALETDGGGWRVPTIRELSSLFDAGRFGPAVDPVAFPDTPGVFHWSSTLLTGDSGTGWGVFYYGDVLQNAVHGRARVRCVKTAAR